MNRIREVNNIPITYLPKGNVMYLMMRDCRIEDNHALLLAQEEAIKNKQGLIICFTIVKDMSQRQYCFIQDGMKEIETTAKKLNIPFLFIMPNTDILSSKWLKKFNISRIISDFSPLKEILSFKQKIPISCFDVDTHNIVPVWITSDKQEYAARTIRSKILKHLSFFGVEPNKITKHPFKANYPNFENNWNLYNPLPYGESISWCKSGPTNGINQLSYFLENIKGYSLNRNNPLKEAISNISPWLHFGFVSSLRCYLNANKLKQETKIKSIKNDINAFIEEIVIRKELSDNYCFYNKKYDSVLGLPEWSLKTLEKHNNDKRCVIYTYNTFLNATTHDKAWNFAQKQLIEKGKIHGYLRMFWCKKIIEWTSNFKTAYEYSIKLNDYYSIDGNDPNGFVGVLWCFGLHDRAWTERNIFGKVRYMSRIGTELNKKL
ncbi:hypothetical protein Yalta_008 [Yalta virus]|nr:hypothetical protein Yalta_008 [Yalta virus]